MRYLAVQTTLFHIWGPWIWRTGKCFDHLQRGRWGSENNVDDEDVDVEDVDVDVDHDGVDDDGDHGYDDFGDEDNYDVSIDTLGGNDRQQLTDAKHCNPNKLQLCQTQPYLAPCTHYIPGRIWYF